VFAGDFETHKVILSDQDRITLTVELLEQTLNNPNQINLHNLEAIVSGRSMSELGALIDSVVPADMRNGHRLKLEVTEISENSTEYQVGVRVLSLSPTDIVSDTIPLSFLKTQACPKIGQIGESLTRIRDFLEVTRSFERSPQDAKVASGWMDPIEVPDYTSNNLLRPLVLTYNEDDDPIHRLTSQTSNQEFGVDIFNGPFGALAFEYLDPVHSYNLLIVTDCNWDRIVMSEALSTPPVVASFGTSGVGDGNFRHPTGVAWAQWRFLVADAYNDRVKIYYMDTNHDPPQVVLDTIIYDQFDIPIDVSAGAFEDVDPGWFYPYAVILDQGNNRVKLWSDGNNIIDTENEYYPNDVVQFTLDNPTAICYGKHPITHKPTQAVYIADNGNNRIVQFFVQEPFPTYGIVEETPPGTFPSDAYLSSVATDNYGFVYVLDAKHSRVYKFRNDLLELIAVFGSGGTGSNQFLHPNRLAIATADQWISMNTVISADLGEAIVTEHYGPNTGVRRYVLGCDILAHELTYIPRFTETGDDKLHLAWWQTGHANATINLYCGTDLLYSDYIPIATPGEHSSPHEYWLDESAPDGYYRYELQFSSIYPGSNSVVIVDSIYVERYLFVERIVVDEIGLFDPDLILLWENSSYPIPNLQTCIYCNEARYWGAYVVAYDNVYDSVLTYCWKSESQLVDEYYMVNEDYSPARLYSAIGAENTDTLITPNNIIYFWLDCTVYDGGSDDGWSGYPFKIYFSANEYDSTWGFDDYDWLDSAASFTHFFEDSCQVECIECVFPEREPGCPFLFQFTDGDGWALVNNILPQSEVISGDVEDYYPLTVFDQGSEVRLRIAETESERSHLDLFELLAYDVPDRFDDVFFSGPDIIRVTGSIPLVSAVTDDSVDILRDVLVRDDRAYTDDGHGYVDLVYRRPSKRYLTPVAASPPWDDRVDIGYDVGMKQHVTGKTAGGDIHVESNTITVSAFQGGMWHEVCKVSGRIRSAQGNAQLTDFFTGDSLVVRLEWNLSARFDYLPLLKTEKLEVDPVAIPLVDANHSESGVVTSLSLADDEYTMLEPGEHVGLAFEVDPPTSPDVYRLYQVHAEGRYEMITKVSEPNLPSGFSFRQNYPNPFNPSTTFEFSLPQSSEVILNIYNVLGQKVRTLVQEEYAAGSHKVDWDSRSSGGSKVASGVYFARLKAGEFTATRKMVVVK